MENEQNTSSAKKQTCFAIYWRQIKKNLPQIAIYTRYLLPVLTVLVLFVMSLFYNVQIANGGSLYEASLLRLHGNTLARTHEYLGGSTAYEKNWFYGILCAGAIVSLLCLLLSLFFSLLAAYTAVRAFRLGDEDERANRYKVIFKIAFPNRALLFVSELLVLVPALFPHFVSLVGTRFMGIGGGAALYVMFNRPLLVVGIFTLLTLALAIATPRFERRKKMNMFLVLHASDEAESEEVKKDSEE